MVRIKRLAAATILAVAASVPGAVLAEQKIVKVDGSSTVFPVTEAVAEEFQASKGGEIQVTVGISGTGGGFKKFVRGELDVTGASRPILEGEMADAKKNGIEYIELPIAFDALTVMVNPKNTFATSLTVEELKKIWEPAAQEKITSWKQVRDTFPDVPLKLFGAGADSGTFDYFTEAIVGKAKASRGDFTASEDDNVLVQGIASDPNALGYFGYAYYAENKDRVKAVEIVNPKGEAVAPTEDSVIKGTYQPLSRPIFIYVNKKSLERPEVKEFVTFFLESGAELAAEVKYVPLPKEAYEKGTARLNAGQTGTVFGGHAEVGVEVSDLYTRDLKS